VIAGPPGAGTTLAHHIMFALAAPDRRALFSQIAKSPP
jgi:circadian clock protein KaiC